MSEMPMHPLQAMLNGMSKAWQNERSKTQMTLGAFIAWLEAHDPDATVEGLGNLMSYRGYYSDLAFDPNPNPRTVADLLTECRGAMGKVFEGYKGGDFMMGATTPLWIAGYGDSCCPRLMGMTDTTPYQPIGALEDS